MSATYEWGASVVECVTISTPYLGTAVIRACSMIELGKLGLTL